MISILCMSYFRPRIFRAQFYLLNYIYFRWNLNKIVCMKSNEVGKIIIIPYSFSDLMNLR